VFWLLKTKPHLTDAQREQLAETVPDEDLDELEEAWRAWSVAHAQRALKRVERMRDEVLRQRGLVERSDRGALAETYASALASFAEADEAIRAWIATHGEEARG
jgi:hypothetical protein